jgi:hypothetical protein
LPSQSEIDITASNSFETWSFSLWQQKTEIENAVELTEFKEALKDKTIIHLMARPLQIYYLDNNIFDENNITSYKDFEQHICRATVSSKDIYHTLQIDDSSIDILFICSTGKCCGLDCCRLNITFIFTICCICLAITSSVCYFFIRSLSASKKIRKLIPFLKFGKHHRVIKRANCQRKVRTQHPHHSLKHESQASEPQSPAPTRKKSQSMKVPPSHRPQLPEILLIPPKALSYSNSVPSKQQRKPKDDEIIL